MNKKVALTGLKNTWKDLIWNIIFWKYKRIAIWDYIKIESIRSWEDYLYQDDQIILKNIEIFERVKREVEKEYQITSNIEDFLGLNIESKYLSDDEILKKINIYKNINSLSTRKKVYTFLDVQDKKWYDFWSKLLVKKVSQLEEDLIVTDCRMLIEAVDLLLEDVLILNVYNSRWIDLVSNTKHFLHSTELQLGSLVNYWIWYNFDITSRDLGYLEKNITEVLESFYSSFSGYSIWFKEKLLELRKEILEEIPNIERNIDFYYENKKFDEFDFEVEKLSEYQHKLRDLVTSEYRKYLFI